MSDGWYVDGVPFILRKKFYPLPPFQFRDIPALPECSSSFEYDFTFERNIISSSETYLKRKETMERILTERRARQEELRILAEEKRRRDDEEGERLQEEDKQKLEEARQIHEEESRLHEDSGVEDGAKSASPVQEISYPPQQLINRTQLPTSPTETDPPHLKPQLHNSVSDVMMSSSSSDNQSSTWRNSGRLNFSDFESEAASPFDTVALRCLDDRGELEKVWANTMNLHSSYFPPPQSNNPFTQGAARSIPHSQDYPLLAQQRHINGFPQTTTVSSLPSRSGTHPAVIPSNFSAAVPVSTSSFVPHSTWSPYYSTTLPQIVANVNPNPIPGMTPTTSHLSSTSIPPPVTSSESFTSFQFPFLSRFSRPTRLPPENSRIQDPPPYVQQRRWNM